MSKQYLALYYNQIFANIHPSWKLLFNDAELKAIIVKCLSNIEYDLRNKGVEYLRFVKNKLNKYIRPEPQCIFEAFKYFDIHNLRVIIIGQDPYPDSKNAHGLSFSSLNGIPDSVRNIYHCLEHSGLLDSTPNTGNLTNWAKQGVLLLNTYLTRTPNIVKTKYTLNDVDMYETYINGNGGKAQENIHKFWILFTKKLLEKLSLMINEFHSDNHEVFVLLWGNHAIKLKDVINTDIVNGNKFTVLEWGHPSPLNRANQTDNEKHFRYCDHFTRINEVYNINWDPSAEVTNNLFDRFYSARLQSKIIDINTIEKLYNDLTNTDENLLICRKLRNEKPKYICLFTDGACSNNGRSGAKAACAFHAPDKYRNIPTATGLLNQSYVLENNVYLYRDRKIISTPSSKCKVTNNRAELLAICYALNTLREKWKNIECKVIKIILVIDSTYAIGWLNLEKLNRYNDENLNPINNDLIRVLYDVIFDLACEMNNGKLDDNILEYFFSRIEIIYQSSHLTKKEKALLTRDQLEIVAGNETADLLATEALNG